MCKIPIDICMSHIVEMETAAAHVRNCAKLQAVRVTWAGSDRSRQAEFSRLGCAVLVVSFGGAAGARRWLEDTGCHFPLLLDPDRRLYRALGLTRSVGKVPA